MSEDKREKLKEFYFQIKECNKCELCKTRTNFVFGSGNSGADIIFIGEAPGRNEDLQGKPFVGQAGKILDELLLSIGFNRSDVFIANVLKCRPPENRDPRLEEINICKKYLFEQVEIIDPRVICTMGRYSTQLLLNTDAAITKLRGKIFNIGNRIVLPINHPAAALYTPSRITLLKEDFQKIKMLLDNRYSGIISDLTDLEKTGEKMLLSDSDSGATPGKIPAVSAEPDTTQSQNEQLGLF